MRERSEIHRISFGAGELRTAEGLVMQTAKAVAEHFGQCGFDGTVTPLQIGFTEKWGVEWSVTVETTVKLSDVPRLLDTIADWLSQVGEEAAYWVAGDGIPRLVYLDGTVQRL